jgi:phosphate transport system ATP-binding protein
LHDNASDLSLGQRQRLCFARALVLDPQVLLLDEPAAHLDHISTGVLEELIYGINSVDRTTILIVTHNMPQASRISDYTLHMQLGELVELGDTAQIFTAPKTKNTELYVTGRIG